MEAASEIPLTALALYRHSLGKPPRQKAVRQVTLPHLSEADGRITWGAWRHARNGKREARSHLLSVRRDAVCYAAPPASVLSQAAQHALARSRTRRI
jgi:hypothetical protein